VSPTIERLICETTMDNASQKRPQMTQISPMDNASQKRLSAKICVICG